MYTKRAAEAARLKRLEARKAQARREAAALFAEVMMYRMLDEMIVEDHDEALGDHDPKSPSGV